MAKSGFEIALNFVLIHLLSQPLRNLVLSQSICYLAIAGQPQYVGCSIFKKNQHYPLWALSVN
jgi:hypothetical protein